MIQDETGDPAFAQTLEAALLKDLHAATVQAVNSKVALSIRTNDGAMIAGLTGTTSYGWLRVNMLWVGQQYRRAGIARQLMHQAFDLARNRGCHGAWLETSNPDARDFYRSIGFEGFGRLENSGDAVPPTHARWFLKVSLAS